MATSGLACPSRCWPTGRWDCRLLKPDRVDELLDLAVRLLGGRLSTHGRDEGAPPADIGDPDLDDVARPRALPGQVGIDLLPVEVVPETAADRLVDGDLEIPGW